MRVLVATAQVPFARRPTEVLAAELRDAIRARGDQAEIVSIPFSWRTREQVLDHVVAARLMDWSGDEGGLGDLLVSLEFPAYLIPHPRRVLWLAHDHAWPGEALDPRSRLSDWCADADRQFLPQIERRFAASISVAANLKARLGLDALPLHPPPRQPGRFAWKRSADFVLVPPGLSPDRTELALRALALTASPLRAAVSAPPSAEAARMLSETARELGLEHRIDWIGPMADDELAHLHATSFAVLFPVLAESLAWAALDAGLSSKAIVVCSDSGAAAELVRDGESGHIVAAEAEAIARALDDLWTHPQRALAWGRSGRFVADSSTLRWSHVLETLLDHGAAAAPFGGGG